MDPLSALNVATSVVQFVDFGSKLISGAHQLWTSPKGQLQEHIELETITKSLVKTSSNFEKSLAKDETRRLSSNAEDIQALCEECQTVAGKLLEALNKLKLQGNQGKWRSVQQALKSILGQEQIESLQKRLDGFRQQLIIAILVALREPVTSLKQEQLEVSGKMDRIAQINEKLGKQFLRDISESRKWRSDLLDAIRNSYRDERKSPTDEVQDSELSPVYRGACAMRFAERILHKLRFKEMPDRHERIAEAYRKTFEWIFESSQNLSRPWRNFVDWLHNDSSIYWITGKPGAGKSTLMKFIYDDPRTSSLLKSSAASPEKIVIAGFFFWNSGISMQMSQDGLIRTLLHDILQQCEDLLPFAFPDRWEAYYLFDEYTDDPWTWSELMRALKTVIKKGSWTRKFVFFIDGLDEFCGDHTDLISLLSSFISQGNVKMCVASRPWVVFEDAFSRAPSLMLQDLTYPDIKHYVFTKLHDNPGFKELEKEEPDYASCVVDEIAKKSSGVFLWVTLVVASLLAGITNGDRISDLQARLDALPADLEDLFTKILGGLEPSYKRHASELFRLVRAAKMPLTLLQMSFADTEDIQSAISRSVSVMSADEKESKAERMRRRLNSRCKGLLESSPGRKDHGTDTKLVDSTVQYLHRTVRDYMEKADNWVKIAAYSEGYYEPYLFLSASYLLQMKTAEKPSIVEFWDYVTWCMEYAGLSADSSVEGIMATAICILDSLDNAAHVVSRRRTAKSASLIDQSCKISPSGLTTYWTGTDCEGRHGLEPSDFFNLAVQCQFEWYVREKIGSGYFKDRDPLLWPPLLCAVSDYRCFSTLHGRSTLCHAQPSRTMIEMLLDARADPNVIYKNSSAWSRVVWELQKRVEDPLWMEIGKLFLKHGADLRAHGAENAIRLLFPESVESKKTLKSPSFLKKAFNWKRASAEVAPGKAYGPSAFTSNQPYGGGTF